MVQLLRESVRRPLHLVDTTRVLGRGVARQGDMLRIEAGTTMEQVATDPAVRDAIPALSTSLLESASVQVRHLATIGGNLLQRTRCGYFRDVGEPACNKRNPGSGCAARGGENRMMAVHCIAAHASDMAVVFMAFSARLHLQGPTGTRTIGVEELYRLPGDRPDHETTLQPGEIIVAAELPVTAATRRSVYLKVRDRASFEFALLSACVGLDMDGDTVRAARIGMGGVGTIPWRFPEVEKRLVGKRIDEKAVAGAVLVTQDGARGSGHNDFKIAMVPRVLARALEMCGEAR
jgi:xanthine dehydrogenase YagS FAD-binding subunit